MEERQQHQQQLQDAAFGVQTQHEAAIDETAALYNQVMASYTTAQHHLVGQPPPGSAGPRPSDVCPSACSRLQVCDGSPSSKENLQRQEDEKLCSCEQKRLEEVIAANQQLLQATNEEMKQAKRLQVSLTCEHVTEQRSLHSSSCACVPPPGQAAPSEAESGLGAADGGVTSAGSGC